MPIRVSGGISGLIYRKLINEFFREITGEAGETSGRIPAKFPWIFLRRILEGKFFVEEVRISGGVLREIARRTTARTAKVIPVVTPKKSSWINLRRRNPQKKKKIPDKLLEVLSKELLKKFQKRRNSEKAPWEILQEIFVRVCFRNSFRIFAGIWSTILPGVSFLRFFQEFFVRFIQEIPLGSLQICLQWFLQEFFLVFLREVLSAVL